MTRFSPTRTYSNAGPECPKCNFVFTPDDSIYFDQDKYTSDECPDCGTKFSVEVYHSVSWTCDIIEPVPSPPSPAGGG